MMRLYLRPEHIRFAEELACQRQADSTVAGAKSLLVGRPQKVETVFLGTLTETAVAKHFGLPMLDSRPFNANAEPDVGPFDVKYAKPSDRHGYVQLVNLKHPDRP